ncbi:MAG: hypothetical protein RL685_3803 [Pseudomonadota bacterium]|jgi:hypothetical protein
MLRRIATLASASILIAGAAHADVPHQLGGWASQSSNLRNPGPLSGRFLAPNLGVVPPFADGQPIPGWSGLLANGDGTFTALPDNGYGSKANSSDYIIGVYTTTVDWKTTGDGTNTPGSIQNLAFISFNDAQGLLRNGRGIDLLLTADLVHYRSGNGFGLDSGAPVDPSIVSGRLLTGYDFDVESIARAADGTLWVGEEFGPYLLHFDANGTLLDEPVPHPFLKSPSNPLVLAEPGTETQGSSRGFESIALNASKDKLYALPEAAPLVDALRAVPGDERVVELFEFDPVTRAYTGVSFKYQKDGSAVGNAIVIGDLTNVGDNKFVLIERDNFFGPNAAIKRLYLIDLDVTNEAGILEKLLLVDLLDLSDPLDIGGELEGVADPLRFSFPFNSIESVVPLGEASLGVAIDNNYPGDAGRRAGIPDDIELIRIDFDQPLSSFSTAPAAGE